MSQFILRMAAYAAKTYHSHNPYDIIEQRDINFGITPRLVDTLGFYAIVNNRRFIRLSEYKDKPAVRMATDEEITDYLLIRNEIAQEEGGLKC